MVVNGKVSTLDKDDLKSVLQNTPVSRLEKAEIMYLCSGTLPHSWSHGECYSKIEYRAEAFLVR
ncbi:hypothetical protein NXU95_05275 [Phocaeicola vulgatus]|nr:hypothetical protein [Phocaeicola vulgatus]